MNHDLRAKIHETIEKNKDSYFDFLKDLVSFDSRIIDAGKTGQEKGIMEYLKKHFAEMGANVDAFAPDNEKNL